LIIRQRGSELLHIGRARRYDRASAQAILDRLSTQSEHMAEMRVCLATLMPAGQVAEMDDLSVIDALATRIARHEVTFVWFRPAEANAPEIIGEGGPPVEAAAAAKEKEERKEEQHFIEIELVAEDEPHDPVAFAKYVVELPDGSIREGYLDEKGKARIDGIPKGDCKVTFPEYGEPDGDGDSKAVETEETEEPPSEKREEQAVAPKPGEECEISQVVVECEHAGKRKKKITLPSADKTPPILEVVGAGKGNGDKIKTSITLSKPRCSAHTGNALEIKTPTGEIIELAEDVSTFEAYYDDASEMSVVRMWPWNETPDEYKLIPQSCHGLAGKEVVVRVYPGYEPSLSFKFSLDTEDRVGAKMKAARQKGKVEKRGAPPHTDWKLEFEAKLKYGKRTRSLTAEYEGKLRQMASVNLAVKRAIDKFTELFYKWVGVAVIPEFPSLELAYEGKYKEIDNSLRVGTEYSLTFKADPLFGITFKIDVLEILINAIRPYMPPVATFLQKVKDWAEENEQKLELTLSFSGLIGGEVGAEKKAENKKPGFKGKIEGKIKVAFAAKAEASAKFLISFAFGAEVGGDTGIAAKLLMDHDDKGLYLKGALTLLECKFKWSAWASGKFIWEVKESYEDEYTLWEDKDLWESGNGYVMTSKQ
jgi:hypothetical protein